MIQAYDFEMRRYMADTYGDVAKSLLWRVATRFKGRATRMRYKGDWAYCSPYSRERVTKEIDRYYILEPKEHVLDQISNPEDHEDYEFSFVIESCTLLCKYTTDASGNTAPASTLVSRPMKRQPSTMLNEGLPHKGKTYAESTSSEGPTWEGAILSSRVKSQPSHMLSEGRKIFAESTSSKAPSWDRRGKFVGKGRA